MSDKEYVAVIPFGKNTPTVVAEVRKGLANSLEGPDLLASGVRRVKEITKEDYDTLIAFEACVDSPELGKHIHDTKANRDVAYRYGIWISSNDDEEWRNKRLKETVWTMCQRGDPPYIIGLHDHKGVLTAIWRWFPFVEVDGEYLDSGTKVVDKAWESLDECEVEHVIEDNGIYWVFKGFVSGSRHCDPLDQNTWVPSVFIQP